MLLQEVLGVILACLGVGGPGLDLTAIVWAETLVSIMLTPHGRV